MAALVCVLLFIEQNGKYSEGLQLNASASCTSTGRTEDCLQGKACPVCLANSCNVWDFFSVLLHGFRWIKKKAVIWLNYKLFQH